MQPKRAFEEDEEDELGLRLKRAQLEKLATSQDVKALLQDERLQKTIQDIDSATNAEQLLDTAMLEPRFQEFCDKVLVTINPENKAV